MTTATATETLVHLPTPGAGVLPLCGSAAGTSITDHDLERVDCTSCLIVAEVAFAVEDGQGAGALALACLKALGFLARYEGNLVAVSDHALALEDELIAALEAATGMDHRPEAVAALR